ncbi:MAG: hypothetical protein PHE38_14270 [Alishewanella agri]|nr:hypothetical protein [Alishewanella agri]
MSNAKVNEIIPQHQTLEALKNHPNAANILEFLQDVLDVETQKKDFYQSLCYWLCENFPDHVIAALAKDPEAMTDACSNEAFIKEVITNFDDFKDQLLKDKFIVEGMALEQSIIQAVQENRAMKDISSEELLAELLERYHTNDLDIKHWLSDVQLNNPKALLPRK